MDSQLTPLDCRRSSTEGIYSDTYQAFLRGQQADADGGQAAEQDRLCPFS